MVVIAVALDDAKSDSFVLKISSSIVDLIVKASLILFFSVIAYSIFKSTNFNIVLTLLFAITLLISFNGTKSIYAALTLSFVAVFPICGAEIIIKPSSNVVLLLSTITVCIYVAFATLSEKQELIALVSLIGLAVINVVMLFVVVDSLGMTLLLGSIVTAVFIIKVGGSHIVLTIATAIGMTLRAFIVRVFASTLYFFKGIKELPSNWWENTFVIDIKTSPELLPGISKTYPSLSFWSQISNFKSETKSSYLYFLLPVMSIVFFLPAYLYRLSIKGTSWFYWPLFFLLRPLPTSIKKNYRERDLCFPILNPLVAFSSILCVLMGVVSLVSLDGLSNFVDFPGVPTYLEYILIVDWANVRIWEWLFLGVALVGFCRVWIASRAIANYKTGIDYSEVASWSLGAMHILNRLHSFLVIISLAVAFGSVAVHILPEQLEYIMPSIWIEAVQNFYGVYKS